MESVAQSTVDLHLVVVVEVRPSRQDDRRRFINVKDGAGNSCKTGRPLGPVYTKRQSQRCDNTEMTLSILFSLKTMESFQIWVAIFQATLVFSMRTVSIASLQHCHIIDTVA